MPMRSYLDDNSAFEPEAITAMSEALERACATLRVNGHASAREAIATRIINLARGGIIDADALVERITTEAKVERVL